MIRTEPIQIPFAYAAGQDGSRFLRALRDEARILASPCPSCGHVSCPARSFCLDCGDATAEPVPVGPGGTLVAWTDVPGRGAFGLVRLDDADDVIIHRLLDASDGAAVPWEIGTRVQACFEAARSGSITDIAGFEAEEQP